MPSNQLDLETCRAATRARREQLCKPVGISRWFVAGCMMLMFLAIGFWFAYSQMTFWRNEWSVFVIFAPLFGMMVTPIVISLRRDLLLQKNAPHCPACGKSIIAPQLLLLTGCCPRCKTMILPEVKAQPMLEKAEWVKLRRRRIMREYCQITVFFCGLFLLMTVCGLGGKKWLLPWITRHFSENPSPATILAGITIIGVIIIGLSLWIGRLLARPIDRPIPPKLPCPSCGQDLLARHQDVDQYGRCPACGVCVLEK